MIEFHSLQKLFEKDFFDKFDKIFKKLLNSFYIIHIHPNNVALPIKIKKIEINPLLEITFIRKDRVKVLGFENIFPNKLDKKNIKKFKEVVLSKNFYKN